jgi:ATP-dependent exoDNAse (exonuclease V) alpha subunit
VDPWTAHAVPFRWLNRNNVDEWVQPKVRDPLPPDDEPPAGFSTNWVFGPALQEAILDGFWSSVVKDESLAVFYTKSSHPIADDIPRLVVGIGDITYVSGTRYYSSGDPTKRRQPIWQREVQHSLRPKGVGGLLVPFHEYLMDTNDPAENQHRRELARRLVIAPEAERIMEFSYRTELLSPDATVSVLTQAIAVVHYLREDKIAEGNWEAAESWLNSRLSLAWQLRGSHPGIGPVLEAMGLRMGTSIVHLLAQLDSRFGDDPWAAVAPVIEGRVASPNPRFDADVAAFRPLWQHYLKDPAKMQLARSLSLVALDAQQAKRWWDPDARRRAATVPVDDAAIIDNPYVLSEVDRGDERSHPVSFSTVDRAALAGHGVAGTVSPSDRRRRRAAVVSILRRVAADGDTLLGVPELKDEAARLPVPEPVDLPDVWLSAEADFAAERLKVADGQPRTVQLLSRAAVAEVLQRKLGARAMRTVDVPSERWADLVEATVTASTGVHFDPEKPRAAAALAEQVAALGTILGRKLTVLVGRAGTGKTTVLGALSRAPSLDGKVLFLAPTGKARVRLETRVAAGTEVMTVAQYLYKNKRYDGARQQPIIGGPCYDAHETIVIDESSMLTEDDLAAVLATFTPAIRRFILVGDPAQLPPIGPGRPFADLVAHLDPLEVLEDEDLDDLETRRGAIARLFHEVRSAEGGGRSDTLRLATWFTDDPASPDAEQIFNEISGPAAALNDLDVRFWDGPDDLHVCIQQALKDNLDVEDADLPSFNRSFLMEPFKSGWFPNDPRGAERWQILSPIRRDFCGCDDLNKWVQGKWRSKALESARNYRTAFGPQEILKHDKVILLKNGMREGYDRIAKEVFEAYLANGEVALVKTEATVNTRRGAALVKRLLFAGRRAEHTFGFFRNEFGNDETGGAIVELAYALTVHKSQGSDFDVVIVVLPSGRMAYRELIYTALTRSRVKLILLVQGSSIADLITLSKPSASETIRRNSNLFRVAVRDGKDRPFARHLIHRAEDGELLRSKSELIIYTQCLRAGLQPMYERRMDAPDGSWKWPDFTFMDEADDPIVWEHLGMLDDPTYVEQWERKRAWYRERGLIEGTTLFTSSERGGLDLGQIDRVIAQVKAAAGA